MNTSELDQQFKQKMAELEDFYQALEWLKGLLLSGEVEMVTVLNWWKEKVK